METIQGHLLFLAAYNLVFFRRFYLNPFLNSTGEMLSTFFPVTLWQGKQWSKMKAPLRDEIYYYEPAAIPFLSTFYPFSILLSVLISKMKIDAGFALMQVVILSHYLLCSVLSYFALLEWVSPIVALFGALSITYAASNVRIQHPCAVYSVCWMPGMLIGGPIGWISFGMSILGGYWPLLVYFVGVAAVVNPSCLIGIFIGLPQILLFAKYWPRSVRNVAKIYSQNKVPWWKFLETFTGDSTGIYINGIMSWEMACYTGICLILAAFDPSIWLLAALFYALLAVTYSPVRIPARALHSFSFCLSIAATLALEGFSKSKVSALIFLQAWLLLRNLSAYPWHPFAQWIRKPSEWVAKTPDYSKFPYFTGYYQNHKTRGYMGGFSLKETCLRNNVRNPMEEWR